MDTASQLSHEEINALVTDIARTYIGTGNFTTVSSSPTTDLDGAPALEIKVVLASEATAMAMPPGATLNTLTDTRTALLDKGDPRFPFFRYSTPEDEAADPDDEE